MTLPALNGRSALGFLAGCGVLRLLTCGASPEDQPRLGWDPVTGQAMVATEMETVDEVAKHLAAVAQAIDDDAVLPGGPPGFPAGGSSGDPMRINRDDFRDSIRVLREAHGDALIDTWVPAMVTDLRTDDHGRVDITLFAAPSGQQKFNTLFGKSLNLVREEPKLLLEALYSWRRYDNVTGEYLDHQVLRSAADTTTGWSTEAGVPGATWLALMALPWLPAHAHRGTTLSSGWQRHPRRRRPVFVWPLWRDMLDPIAVRTLLTHPAMTVRSDKAGELTVSRSGLAPLSVFMVQGAARQPVPQRKFAGVLAPEDVTMK